VKLSVCIIVKDELNTLPGCVESIRAAVDEIVIVDTGSTDGTKELAQNLADVFDEFQWEDPKGDGSGFDFSKARNHAIGLATGDWILSIDADEKLAPESVEPLRKVCEDCPSHYQLLLPIMRMVEEGRVIQQFLVERLFRKGWTFDLPMHNVINVESDRRTPCPSIVLYHDRDSRPTEARRARNVQRVAMARSYFIPKIEENPKDHRSLFYLAGTERDAGNWEEAMKCYDQYFQVAEWDLERYQAAIHASQCLVRLDQIDRARQILSAELIDNYQRAEGYFLLGQLAVIKHNFPEAKHWFLIAAGMKVNPYEPFFLDVDIYSWLTFYNLAQVCANMGDWEEAKEWREKTIAAGAPEDAVKRLAKMSGRIKPPRFTRLAFFVDRGQKDFLEPLFARWDGRYEMKMCDAVEDIPELLEWCEVAWFEWAGPLLIAASKLPKTKRIVVRIHGYEIHDGLLRQVDWSKVDEVIFTAHYQESLAIRQVPAIEQCNRFIAHAGIDSSRFSIAPDIAGIPGPLTPAKPGNKIAMACYLNSKKNLPMALQIMAELVKTNPDMELHITGTWQDSRLSLYCEKMVGELGLHENVFFEPWPEDLNAWYADKSFFLSTSIEESLEVTMAEAMAAGLCPIVHCWISSEEYYPHAQIFSTVGEAVSLIQKGAGTPQDWREWAEERLDISVPGRLIDRVMEPPVVWVGMRDMAPHRIEHYLGAAVVGQGCVNNPDDKPDMVLLCDPAVVKDPKLTEAGGKKVFWYAEQVMGDDDISHRKIEMAKAGVDWADVLVTSHEEAGKVLMNGQDKGHFSLYLGGAHAGYFNLNRERTIDVGFLGIINERRQGVIDKLKEAGINVEVLTGEYEPGKTLEFWNKCKIALNIHYTDALNNETRIAEGMSCGCCVVTEPLTEDQPFGIWPVQAEAENLSGVIKELLASGDWQGMSRCSERWIWSRLRLDQQVEKLLVQVGL